MSEGAGTGPGRALERKLATILSADVAEYSRLMSEDEEGTLRVFRSHTEVFEQLVSLHRGRIFNTAGDAILAEFPSAVEAVRCATDIQAALRTRNDQLVPSRQVRFRIGVNLGDVMVQGSDLLGDGVNVAARLQAAAQPGGICVSGSVYDQVRNKLSLSFKSLGEQSFKNIPQPVRAFSITESDAHGAFPSPSGRLHAATSKTLAAALLLLVMGGGGFWAYFEWQRRQAELARILGTAEVTRQEAARREAQLLAEKQAAEEAHRRAEAERQVARSAQREAQLAAERAKAEQVLRAAEIETQRARDEARRASEELRKNEENARRTAAPPTSGAGSDGLYAGPICYGPSPDDHALCYRAEGTVAGGKIIGRWPARQPGMTLILSGLVSASGEVQIDIHSETPDMRRRLIHLSGILRGGKLDATGAFLNGRSVTLNWGRQ